MFDFLFDTRVGNAVTVLMGVGALVGVAFRLNLFGPKRFSASNLRQVNVEDALTENWFYVSGDNASKSPNPNARTVEATGTIHLLASNPSEREVRFVSAQLQLRPPFPGIFDLKRRKFRDAKISACNVRVRNHDGTLDDKALVPPHGARDVFVDFSVDFVLTTLWNRQVPIFMVGKLSLTDNWKTTSRVKVKVWRAGIMVLGREA